MGQGVFTFNDKKTKEAPYLNVAIGVLIQYLPCSDAAQFYIWHGIPGGYAICFMSENNCRLCQTNQPISVTALDNIFVVTGLTTGFRKVEKVSPQIFQDCFPGVRVAPIEP